MSPPQPARGARSRACAICALLAGRGRRSRCRGADAARRRARPRHRHRRAADDDAARDPDDDREHHRRSRSSRRINADRRRGRAQVPAEPDRCASATSATTTTPCWRRAPRAPATAPARSSTPTASCSRTCSATAPASRRAGASSRPRRSSASTSSTGRSRPPTPGNSAGAIVDFVTRMPTRFEAHAKLQGFAQRVPAVRHRRHLLRRPGRAPRSAAAPARCRGGSTLSHLTSDAQPIELRRQERPGDDQRGAASRSPAPSPTAIRRRFRATCSARRSRRTRVQDHAKLKLAYDVTPTLRASLHASAGGATTPTAPSTRSCAMRRAATVTSGPTPVPVNIDGRSYTVLPTDFARSTAATGALHPRPRRQEQHARRVGLRGRRQPVRLRARHRARGADAERRATRGAGRITDQHGTGWNTLARKGTWRPDGVGGAHVVEFGAAARRLQAARRVVSDTPDWSGGEAAARFSAFAGRTSLTSLWAQDAWRFAPDWRAVLGVRGERWQRRDGSAVERDDDAGLRAAQRVVPVAEGRALLAGERRLAAAKPRSAAPCACRPSASCTRARSRPTRSSTTTRT